MTFESFFNYIVSALTFFGSGADIVKDFYNCIPAVVQNFLLAFFILTVSFALITKILNVLR